MEAPILRQVRRDELEAILQLYADLHSKDEPLSPERAQTIWSELLSNPQVQLFAAEADGKLVASCVLSITPNLTRGGRAYGLIENVVTHRDYRRRGIGTALLRYALESAWSAGCYKVMLLTGRKAEEVDTFYKSA